MSYTNGLDNPSLYFNTVLYTGTGADLNINTVGFQSDLVWLKSRSNGTTWHILADAVRGEHKHISSNNGETEKTDAEGVGFITDGFSLGADTVDAYYGWNLSGNTYVSWNWLAGGTASSNTDGSITSSVSASTTSGFSIVSWTGTGANGTIGHGLGTSPSMIIVKARGAVKDWMVGHNSLGWTKYINLNTTSASSTASTVWQDTAPTSSVFSVGSSSDVNTSSTAMIAYCFAEKKGFSKFGSYTGNGNADGTFVYTGFKPAFVVFKVTSNADSWVIKDNKRDPINQMSKRIFPDLSNAEDSGSGGEMDFLSNGFKFRSGSTSLNNFSGYTYIYMAFAESPFTTSTGIPTTAR